MALGELLNFGTINWGNIYYYVMVFIYTCVVSAILAYGIYWSRFRYRVIVRDKRNDRNAATMTDRGRIYVASDGTIKLKLWQTKKTIDAPPKNCIYQHTGAMLSKGFIDVFLYGNDSYTFLNLEGIEVSPKLIPIEAKMADNSRRAREVRTKFQNPSMLEKYGALAMTLIVFLVLTGSLIYAVSTNKAIAESNAGAASNIAKAVADIKNPGNAQSNAEPETKDGVQKVDGVTNGFGLL